MENVVPETHLLLSVYVRSLGCHLLQAVAVCTPNTFVEPTCLLLLPKKQSPWPLCWLPFWGCWIRAGCWGAGTGSGGLSLFLFFCLSFTLQLFSEFAFGEKRCFFWQTNLIEILVQLMTCGVFVFPTLIACMLLDALKQHLHLRVSRWIKYICNGIQPHGCYIALAVVQLLSSRT